MLKRIFSPSPFKTFYLVFAYIMAFAIWWAYLLYEKNETAYKEQVALNQLTFRQTSPAEDYQATKEYQQIHSKYERQKLMILGEGSVFILLLLFGLMRVRKVFFREMQLADQQHNFLLSVTHELKSPLSTIKLSLQTLAARKLELEKSGKLIVNSLSDLDRLEALVDNILFAAKIEHDEPGFANEEISISDVVQLAVERFSQNKKSVSLDADVKKGVYLNADLLGFTSVVTNLIENAVKYSEPGSKVEVTLKDDDSQVFLTVSDQGPGIPGDEKTRVFEKFYRIGNEDTRKTKGTGLGLYIVKRFVEIYKGGIEILDNTPKGSVFSLSFNKTARLSSQAL